MIRIIRRIAMKWQVYRLITLVAILAASVLPARHALAMEPQNDTFHDEGSFEIGPCPSGVTLVETYTEDDRIITFFDQAGDPTSVQFHFNYEGVVTNPETGQSVRDPAHGTRYIDFVAGTRGPVGLYFSITVPGVGVVFHDVGRLVRNLEDDSIIFEAGPHDMLHGDYVGLFCAALGA
jgi:hypothetical protein